MSKGKSTTKPLQIAKSGKLDKEDVAVDPTLASLFASSSGPVAAPARITKARAAIEKNKKNDGKAHAKDAEQENNSEEASDPETSESEDEIEQPESRPRKRRRLSLEDDLEATYLNRLAKEEQKENVELLKGKDNGINVADEKDENDDDTASSASNDLEDLSDVEPEDAVPQHESLSKSSAEHDKTRRTVFLGNVSTEAIKSKSSRKELETHLKSALEGTEAIESLRFRSTAFNITAGPKKAAYAKKDLMDDTSKCTNAYAVLNTEAAARRIAKRLNGTMILNRHLHTDWLAHPTATDHKRCIFVGNLNFVDLESNMDTNDDGDKQNRRPKAKEPADAEEGLWRSFGKCGTIESVRVVRDKTTRIGKGFAYVQFTDEVGAEKALALDGKKFPPMLPRLLRVSRAKKVLKKDLKRKREENQESKGRSGPARPRGARGQGLQKKKFGGVVFEGYRASSDNAMKFKTKGKKKGGVKPTSRSSKRGSMFKASGGKKKRDV